MTLPAFSLEKGDIMLDSSLGFGSKYFIGFVFSFQYLVNDEIAIETWIGSAGTSAISVGVDVSWYSDNVNYYVYPIAGLSYFYFTFEDDEGGYAHQVTHKGLYFNGGAGLNTPRVGLPALNYATGEFEDLPTALFFEGGWGFPLWEGVKEYDEYNTLVSPEYMKNEEMGVLPYLELGMRYGYNW